MKYLLTLLFVASTCHANTFDGYLEKHKEMFSVHYEHNKKVREDLEHSMREKEKQIRELYPIDEKVVGTTTNRVVNRLYFSNMRHRRVHCSVCP